jgi:peptidoglycan/xylan/chitin deacetylase (PgdA/CDA1 family)
VLKQGWNQIIIHPSGDWLNDGGESWSNTFIKMRVKMHAKDGETCSASYDLLQNGLVLKPKVILTFDDGSAGVYTKAFPYMQARGIRGVSYIGSLMVDTANYMTKAQLTELYNAGWDIGNHTAHHWDLTTKTYEEIIADIQIVSDWLVLNGFTKRYRHFSVPAGAVNADVTLAIANSNLKTARNSRDGFSYPLLTDVLAISAKAVLKTHTLANITAWLDTTLANGYTAVLMFHDIQDTAPTTYVWETTKFQGLVDYCIANSVAVVTMEDWYNNLEANYEYA